MQIRSLLPVLVLVTVVVACQTTAPTMPPPDVDPPPGTWGVNRSDSTVYFDTVAIKASQAWPFRLFLHVNCGSYDNPAAGVQWGYISSFGPELAGSAQWGSKAAVPIVWDRANEDAVYTVPKGREAKAAFIKKARNADMVKVRIWSAILGDELAEEATFALCGLDGLMSEHSDLCDA